MAPPKVYQLRRLVAAAEKKRGPVCDYRAVELIKARTIQLTWDGDRICALIGTNLQDGISGFGSTAQEALRDLATEIERHVVAVWVPRPATQYREGGVLKSDCPECGHVHEMTEFDQVIAYVCDNCGAGVDVLPET